MPLEKGKSQKTFGKNVSELLDSYKAGGKIGNTTPKNAEHARKIAVAIAYREKKGSKKK